ncbi:hypothetical protein K501DRAFT_276811 [Backusella circina FSU 941]|nr:hypothetical protein K501DRAFT_276811 [Backusella circina FSU 941]
MKFFYLLFFFLLSLVSCQRSDGRAIIYGKIQPNDALLLNTTVVKEGHFLRTQEDDYDYTSPEGEIIHAIRLTDQNKKGKRGYANIVKGGVGFNQVELHVRSLRGQGYNFTVEIFGS